jgi:hypothetical protein
MLILFKNNVNIFFYKNKSKNFRFFLINFLKILFEFKKIFNFKLKKYFSIKKLFFYFKKKLLKKKKKKKNGIENNRRNKSIRKCL